MSVASCGDNPLCNNIDSQQADPEVHLSSPLQLHDKHMWLDDVVRVTQVNIFRAFPMRADSSASEMTVVNHMVILLIANTWLVVVSWTPVT